MTRDDKIEEHDDSVDLTLLSNFIHQVVQPLNAVAGTLDNLAKGVIGPDRRDQRLKAARAQIEQCISLMRNLAFLSKGFDKLPPSEMRTIVMPQMLIESAMFFQEDAERRGLKITIEDRATQNKLKGHNELVRQVFMNIFDNCVKYCKDDTVVGVDHRYRDKENDIITAIRCFPKKLPTPTEIPLLCNLGFRGNNAKEIVASGTGLGLHICKRIVEDIHGGRLLIQTYRGEALDFFVILPNAEKG